MKRNYVVLAVFGAWAERVRGAKVGNRGAGSSWCRNSSAFGSHNLDVTRITASCATAHRWLKVTSLRWTALASPCFWSLLPGENLTSGHARQNPCCWLEVASTGLWVRG